MLSAPLSPAWIVAVYLPARIVAVWGKTQHRIVIMKLHMTDKSIDTSQAPTSPSRKVAEKCTLALTQRLTNSSLTDPEPTFSPE